MAHALMSEPRTPLMWFVKKPAHRMGLGNGSQERFFCLETAGGRNLRVGKDKWGLLPKRQGYDVHRVRSSRKLRHDHLPLESRKRLARAARAKTYIPQAQDQKMRFCGAAVIGLAIGEPGLYPDGVPGSVCISKKLLQGGLR